MKTLQTLRAVPEDLIRDVVAELIDIEFDKSDFPLLQSCLEELTEILGGDETPRDTGASALWASSLSRINAADVSTGCKKLAEGAMGLAFDLLESPSVFWDSEDDSITFEENVEKRMGRAIEVFGSGE